ncbi:TIGR01244 family sulfur transferase [Sulfitobacter sp. F26204]|uniref:TIGR01244 family sulfur transferase n=1 Tax=Sulfitobacter sp. F26204 TaxID=2996014 RepID=UPI00225DEC7F|nr:TIGR01244 family sulfur transferase [Sulfitobacter sp. F26204]MCX7560103.1 TIGR01244 family sulfur transferase [Sulfitobacter sp. F26204]
MNIRQLTPRYFVSPQIASEDMADLKAAGITRILCNRPDAEVPPTHASAAIRDAAEAAGLSFVQQPLTHQSMVPDVIAKNRDLGSGSDEVVLAYCASGTRSTIAWALAQAGEMEADHIIETAANAGYDIAHMRGALAQPFI